MWYKITDPDEIAEGKTIAVNANGKKNLSELKNIGPTIEKRLNEIGIKSKSDLKRVGPATAYKRIQKKYPDKTIPVCYYLYSFQGALEGKHWDSISEKTKQSLLSKIRTN